MLITFEGIDGAGKSTIIQELNDQLAEEHDILVTREPDTDTKIGDMTRDVITDSSVNELSMLFMFLADHSHHVLETIQPALNSGKIVLCDRYIDSRYAYQSETLSDEISMNTLEWLRLVQEEWTRIPDRTIILDISPEESLNRIDAEDVEDRFEQEQFLKQVRQNYLSLAETNDRYRVVDAEQEISQVVEECLSHIQIDD